MKELRKNLIVYLLLGLSWPAMVAWLVYEHATYVTLAEQSLLSWAREKTDTIAELSRAGARGFGWVGQGRLVVALNTMTKPGDQERPNLLQTVALLNKDGDQLLISPPDHKLNLNELPAQGQSWDPVNGTLTVVNLVDLNTLTDDSGTSRPLLIETPDGEGRPGPPPPQGFDPRNDSNRTSQSMPDGARGGGRRGGRGGGRGGPGGDRGLGGPGGPGGGPDQGRRGQLPGRFRPDWMSDAQYNELVKKNGLHAFVLVLSTAKLTADIEQDFWLRTFIAGLALLAVGGMALGWRSLEKSTRLQMRLVRAHELNTHLQEMNLSAAGLAHETRNPLNIVRGLAQLISQRETLPEDIRDRSQQITEEVDRVTVRLNEFINYSRPPEPRLAPVNLTAIVRDVERTLESDTSEKGIAVELTGPDLNIEADESLLRQVLFNLLLNATQAVGNGGKIVVGVAPGMRGEATVSIEDNGPGVPENQEEEIFRPYFTTNTHGSGLGLAVVKQIVLAHHWEIEYVRSGLGGACFRVSGLRVL